MKAAALLLLSLGLPIWTRAAPAEIKCNDAGSMVEMAACARDTFNSADAELNRTYRELLSAGAAEPVFIANLRKAQKAWLRFRDSELASKFACEHQDDRQCFGSMITLDWPAYKTELTRERTQQLAKLLEDRFPKRQRSKTAQ